MKKKYDFRLYEYQLSDEAPESLISEIEGLIDSEDQSAVDAGIDFLEAVNYMMLGRSIPATVMPSLYWRTRLPSEEYVYWRSCSEHKFYITLKLSSTSRELRAVHACPTRNGVSASVDVALVRHSRM